MANHLRRSQRRNHDQPLPSRWFFSSLLEQAGINPDECAYCGARGSDLDHFYALVKNKRPSGYFHNARNLVPSCGTCNQSKGGHPWEKWMLGAARNSPTTRAVKDISERIARLRKFEAWGALKAVPEEDLRIAVGAERWEAYWHRLEEIKTLMFAAQEEADRIRLILEEKFGDGAALANRPEISQ